MNYKFEIGDTVIVETPTLTKINVNPTINIQGYIFDRYKTQLEYIYVILIPSKDDCHDMRNILDYTKNIPNDLCVQHLSESRLHPTKVTKVTIYNF